MTNPLGTKEQREALRRGYETTIRTATGDFWRYEPTQTTLSALDGLDIAEEMRDLLNDCRGEDGSVELRRNLWKNKWDSWLEGGSP